MHSYKNLFSFYVPRPVYLLLLLFWLTTPRFGRGQFFQPSDDGDVTLSVALKPPPPENTFPFGPVDNSIIPRVAFPSPQQRKQYAHNAVLFSAEQESKLPAELLNPFYKNPRTAEALAKQSWFGPGEKHVVDRETEKIPRDQIFYVLKSAGLIRRKRSIKPSRSIYYPPRYNNDNYYYR